MIFLRRAAGTILLIGGMILPALVLGPIHDPSFAKETTTAVKSIIEREEENFAEPVYAFIPRIGVAATIVPVGLDEDRQMESPGEWTDIGWYEHGVYPGEKGNAVLAGHLDSDIGPAVFWDLSKLQRGDIVIVVDKNGEQRRFSVTGSERYATDNVPMHYLFGKRGDARLVLVTCEGKWGDEGYEERLVVFAEPIERF